MAKITWDNRTNSGEASKISASIFNDTKTSVNAVYDVIEARLGTTSSAADVALTISGTVNISGSLLPNTIDGENTSSFNLGSPTAAWKELYVSTASINFVSPDGTITKFSKKDVTDLKSGKSLSTTGSKQLTNEVDDTTYVRMGVAGKAFHYASNKTLIKLQTSSFELGDTTVPAQILGSSVAITGSTTISGSSVFTTTDLLTLLGNFGQTGSFAVTGSSSFTGDVNMDGAVTTQDLLTVVAGINATGSVDVTGSVTASSGLVVTGSTTITGSFAALPPPLIPGSGPITKTIFYGYKFTGGVPDALQVQASSSYNPNLINFFRFNTSSQKGFNDLTVTNQSTFFTGLGASSSNQQFADLTFTPTAGYPSHSYHFKVNSVSSAANYKQVGVSFIGSSSLVGIAPSTISQFPSQSNGRWKFIIPPTSLEQPGGGWAVGDLLNVLATYGASGIETGSMGDYNFDGAINVTDLMTVLAGYGNGNVICGQDVLVPQSTNHQLIGPTITVCEDNVFIISSGSFSTITL